MIQHTEFPHYVEISHEHHVHDLEQWFYDQGLIHGVDWKAIYVRHRGFYSIYFANGANAMLCKLTWC
jgi:hypothetical protein